FFSSRRRHTRFSRDWSSDVCSSDLAFSSSIKDTAFSYIHDFGFIPKVKTVDGQEVRGFTVMFGGGLGAQPILAHKIHDFLPEERSEERRVGKAGGAQWGADSGARKE